MLDLQAIRAVMFDMDGVLYRGPVALPGVNRMFGFLEQRDIPFACVTNNAARTADSSSGSAAGAEYRRSGRKDRYVVGRHQHVFALDCAARNRRLRRRHGRPARSAVRRRVLCVGRSVLRASWSSAWIPKLPTRSCARPAWRSAQAPRLSEPIRIGPFRPTMGSYPARERCRLRSRRLRISNL